MKSIFRKEFLKRYLYFITLKYSHMFLIASCFSLITNKNKDVGFIIWHCSLPRPPSLRAKTDDLTRAWCCLACMRALIHSQPRLSGQDNKITEFTNPPVLFIFYRTHLPSFKLRNMYLRTCPFQVWSWFLATH